MIRSVVDGPQSSGSTSQVVIYKRADWNAAAFETFLAETELLARVRNARLIVIKPNLCAGTVCDSSTGVVSSPEVLRSLLGCIRELNSEARILIVESDSTGFGFAYEKIRFQKYDAILGENAAEFLDLTRCALKRYRVPRPYRFRDGIWLSNVFEEADVFLSLGKLKTHTMTTVSISLKNLFGCLPEMDKSHHHPWVHETVADIAQVIRPDLQVIDSSPALEGNGPVHGEPLPLDYVIVGSDPVATDAVCSRILGFDPARIKHLTLSSMAGVGRLQPDRLVIPHGAEIGDLLGRPAKFAGWQAQLLNGFGLAIQKVGLRTAHFGDILHMQLTFGNVIRGAGRRFAKRWKRRRRESPDVADA